MGQPAAQEIDERLISISLDKIANIPVVIGVACGAAKARAILGALNGGYLDVLIIDSDAVEIVLELAKTTDVALRRGA
jgi:deoxyribonucleoside regulator